MRGLVTGNDGKHPLELSHARSTQPRAASAGRQASVSEHHTGPALAPTLPACMPRLCVSAIPWRRPPLPVVTGGEANCREEPFLLTRTAFTLHVTR